MPLIEPLVTVAQTTRQTVQAVSRQPEPSVESVNQAARPIVGDIVRPVGDTVGVLTFSERTTQGGLEGAGMHSGGAIVV